MGWLSRGQVSFVFTHKSKQVEWYMWLQGVFKRKHAEAISTTDFINAQLGRDPFRFGKLYKYHMISYVFSLSILDIAILMRVSTFIIDFYYL
jgi:hypothetical protein